MNPSITVINCLILGGNNEIMTKGVHRTVDRGKPKRRQAEQSRERERAKTHLTSEVVHV